MSWCNLSRVWCWCHPPTPGLKILWHSKVSPKPIVYYWMPQISGNININDTPAPIRWCNPAKVQCWWWPPPTLERERRLKIYHACPSPTSPHTKLSSCCINSNWNKKLMVLLEFSVKEINIHGDQHPHHWAGCTIGRVQTCWVGGDTHGPML